MSTPSGPNPIIVGTSVLRARLIRRPTPHGTGDADHSALAPVLSDLKAGGVPALLDHRSTLASYRSALQSIDPNGLSSTGALAYWMNLYNAGALDLAAEANSRSETSVLRVAGGFQEPWAHVGGESLSLDAIEHGKIRRFQDPRIHGGLVCGSASCPTLRYEPFQGATIESQLEDQMRSFLANGGAVMDEATGALNLSRIFLWYGADFTRPNRMPTLLPARKKRVADALGRWLPANVEEWRITVGPRVQFQPYDWSLACSIG
ncbi:MAG: DUF547 domain-containing protein [Acidimicrobiia bacterium]|nr:DUF547 domain-containing protein [Acidimicrobiia bacterium]